MDYYYHSIFLLSLFCPLSSKNEKLHQRIVVQNFPIFRSGRTKCEQSGNVRYGNVEGGRKHIFL